MLTCKLVFMLGPCSRLHALRSQIKVFVGRKQEPPKQQNDFSLLLPFNWTLTSPDDEPPRIAAVCHIFHTELTDTIFAGLRNLPAPANIFISTDTVEKSNEILLRAGEWSIGRLEVRVVENRGRDIGPKLVAFADIYSSHDLVLFLHSKKATHTVSGNAWRDQLFHTLMGSSAIVQSILTTFQCQPDLGIIAPQHLPEMRIWIVWRDTYDLAQKLAKKMGFAVKPYKTIDFPAGSMFWVRTRALQPLLDLHLTNQDFAAEQAQIGGTIAHALERLFLFSAERAGFTWIKVSTPEHAESTAVRVSCCADIADFLSKRGVSLLRQHGNS